MQLQDSLTANLYRLIRHMRSTEKKDVPKKLTASTAAEELKKHELSEKFPFLAIPDNPEVQSM